jgi:ABC-type sugar transport system permease subunit
VLFALVSVPIEIALGVALALVMHRRCAGVPRFV